MSARAIAIHGNKMSGERRANLEIKSECPALTVLYISIFIIDLETETKVGTLPPVKMVVPTSALYTYAKSASNPSQVLKQNYVVRSEIACACK